MSILATTNGKDSKQAQYDLSNIDFGLETCCAMLGLKCRYCAKHKGKPISNFNSLY